MKYAIVSDVHANLEAVDACFKMIDEIKPDKIACLGDMVDYCAQPNDVVSIIKSRCDIVVLGNHDEAQFNYTRSDGFSENAKISSIHTRSVIDPEFVEWFKTLPYTYSENNLLFVHGSPAEPKNFRYVFDSDSAKQNFQSFNEGICFIGHSHMPVIFELKKGSVSIRKQGILSRECRYIINVGSVGQPRNMDPKLCFGVFDTNDYSFNYERVEYDVRTAASKILNEGLPNKLAERLESGI